ncbi:STAS domain-containing protein [Streptomyces cinerochromogenes]|uniref:STAS domain-containing protein n=1 Tax=Streptomyces cinerochromogenes TaxID=66422 RepID=UPI00369E1DD4
MSGPEPERPLPAVTVPQPAVPRLEVQPLTGRTGFRAAGEVSLPTRRIWERALDRAVREGEDVYYLELSALTFVDVAGVGALADAARGFGGRRRLVLDRPPDTVPRILDLLWPGLPGIEVAP